MIFLVLLGLSRRIYSFRVAQPFREIYLFLYMQTYISIHVAAPINFYQASQPNPITTPMASFPPHGAISLAQSMDPANLNGVVRFEEAIGQMDSMKLLQLEKPIVVNKPLGAVRARDPVKDEINDTLKKEKSFF